MFPELNNLLSTTPDRTEQVRCRADRKRACPGSVQYCIRDSARWSRFVCGKPRASGSCSLKRARRGCSCIPGPVEDGLPGPSYLFISRFQGHVLRATLAPRGGCRTGPRGEPLTCPKSPSTLEHFTDCMEHRLHSS